MAKTDYLSVDEYIRTHAGDVQAILQRVRGVIRKAIPDAEEGISYQIPTYKLAGRPVLSFAGWKEHLAVYPATGRMAAEFKGALDRYRVSKGTLRFPLSKRVPLRLIARIARFRAGEVAERAAAGRPGPRRRGTGRGKLR